MHQSQDMGRETSISNRKPGIARIRLCGRISPPVEMGRTVSKSWSCDR
jgi:hypothetical protein